MVKLFLVLSQPCPSELQGQSGEVVIMFQSFRKSTNELQAIERVIDWTKARFKLPTKATVMVAEINCQVPGCPPLETIIAFWSDAEIRYRIKLFKPVVDVTEDDLPISWLLPTLVDENDLFCDCC